MEMLVRSWKEAFLRISLGGTISDRNPRVFIAIEN
jgi:hypothetical protein